MVGRDDMGKAIHKETQIVVPHVMVAPRTTERKINGVTEYVYTSTYSLYLPPNTEVLDDDIFIVRGIRFFKDGNPVRWDLAGDSFLPAGIEITVTTVNGQNK